MVERRQPAQPQGGKTMARLGFAGVLLAVLASAAAIPFFFESMTMWYKVGMDKHYLRLAKVLGLWAVAGACAQSLLGLRPGPLVVAFGAPRLLRWHRRLGVLVVVLAVAHVLLVLVPEGLANLPLGFKYWPEMVGAATLLLLAGQLGSSYLREKRQWNYPRWRNVHRVLAWAIVLAMALHVTTVSETFARPLPLLWLVLVVGGTALAHLWVGIGRLRG